MAAQPDQTMKPTPFVAALIAALAFSASFSVAQQPNERPGPPPRGQLFRALDTDEDGTISSGEIDGSTASLRTLDANSDGDLTKDELKIGPPPKPADGETDEAAPHPQGPPPEDAAPPKPEDGSEKPAPPEGGARPPHGKPPVPPLFAALDTDRDGKISSDELEAAPKSLKSLDKNEDGELTDDELRPPLPPQGDKPQGPPPGGKPPKDGTDHPHGPPQGPPPHEGGKPPGDAKRPH